MISIHMCTPAKPLCSYSARMYCRRIHFGRNTYKYVRILIHIFFRPNQSSVLIWDAIVVIASQIKYFSHFSNLGLGMKFQSSYIKVIIKYLCWIEHNIRRCNVNLIYISQPKTTRGSGKPPTTQSIVILTVYIQLNIHKIRKTISDKK